MNIMTQILQILFAGLTTTATSMGGAIVAMVQAVFLTGTGENITLNIFGQLVVVFAGISLALQLFRWSLGFITSFGRRNR